jgi:hypothetical protein
VRLPILQEVVKFCSDSIVRTTHSVVLVLVKVQDRLILLTHHLRSIDTAASIQDFRLCWTPEQRSTHGQKAILNQQAVFSHVQSEELHKPELRRRCLVAQEGADILYAVDNARCECQRDDRRTRAVFNDRLRFLGLNFLGQHVQRRHDLYVVRWVHRHHLRVYPHTVIVVRIES